MKRADDYIRVFLFSHTSFSHGPVLSQDGPMLVEEENCARIGVLVAQIINKGGDIYGIGSQERLDKN